MNKSVNGSPLSSRGCAALRLTRYLKPAFRWLGILRIVPSPLRDAIYRVVARYRYAWFGKREVCRMPTPELKARFL